MTRPEIVHKPYASTGSETDMIAVTSFFNPSRYASKKQNFARFRARLATQGVPLAVIECAFDDAPYEIADDDAELILRVRSRARLWQKERLLNIAIAHLPHRFEKFASLDCDVLFEDDAWATEASRLLDDFPAIQPFAYSYRLRRNETTPRPPYAFGPDDGQRLHSFAKGMHDRGGRPPRIYREGGSTGFAWAFRRDAFPGFYDRLILGSGDNFFANACFGFEYAPMKSNAALRRDLNAYVPQVYARIRGRLGFCAGMLLHLWHGSRADRGYHLRYKALSALAFDPRADLTLEPDGCWTAPERIERAASAYFDARREDG